MSGYDEGMSKIKLVALLATFSTIIISSFILSITLLGKTLLNTQPHRKN